MLMYTRSKNITWNEVEDGAIVLLLHSGQYIHLDKNTCALISALESGTSFEDHVKRLAAEHSDCDHDQIFSDYESVMEVLIQHGIVEVGQ